VIGKHIRYGSSRNGEKGRTREAFEKTEDQVDSDILGEGDRQVEHCERNSVGQLRVQYLTYRSRSLTPEYRKAQVQDSASTDELARRTQEH
jgi:hypothetical protein